METPVLDEPEESVSVISVPLVVALVAVLFFIALLQRERDLAVAAALVLGVTGCARLWSRASLRNLHIASLPDRTRLFPGESLSIRIVAENRKFLPVLVKVEIPAMPGTDAASPGPATPGPADSGAGDEPPGITAGDGAALKRETGLLWHQRGEFAWGFEARRRGVYNLGPFRVSAGDFLGFYKREREETGVSIIVYPRISPVSDFSLRKRDLFGKAGRKSPVHDPVYILGTRDYQHWQPARYIHWKASARYGSLKEKIFDPSEQEKVLIAIDARGFSENRASAEFEKAIEGAASLSVRLEREGYAAGLITNAVLTGGGRAVIQPGRNSAQLGMMLETMARMRMDWNLNLRDFLRRGLSFPWGMICVIFSFSADDILTEGAFFTGRGIPYSGVAVVPPEVGPCRPDTGRAGFPVIALDDLLSVIDRTEAR